MKKFIAYTIKHAENNGNIERRYKQFDWLDQRLTEQFPCSLRPQLPEKQASGRFEHEFIERRKVSEKIKGRVLGSEIPGIIIFPGILNSNFRSC